MIELIAIGDELLQGMTVNSNVVYLSHELQRHGYVIARHTTLPDDVVVLRAGIAEALKRAQIVILTGGLGPTCDDHTRQVIAELLGVPLEFQQDIADDLILRFGSQLESTRDQATQPKGAQILLNPVGTAPGLFFKEGIIVLPGVPREMQAIFQQSVLPVLKKNYPPLTSIRSTTLYLHTLNENQVDPVLRPLKRADVDIGIYPGYGMLSITIRAPNEEDVIRCVQEIQQQFGEYLYETEDGSLEEPIHRQLIALGKTIALAESCTGGRLAAQLTRLPNASSYFLGSIVAYSNALKQELLGVSLALLEEHGAVSREVVEAMWNGVLAKTDADIAIAVSGIVGPGGGSEEKPVGTIWASVGLRGSLPTTVCFLTRGTRETRMLTTVNRLLGLLFCVCSKKKLLHKK